MHLFKLWAQHLRLFDHLEIELSPAINVFVGDNGAGKTSILEAVDILSRGKSFRTPNISEVVAHHEEELVIAAEILESSQQSTHLGIAKNGSGTQLRIDQQNVARWSELTQYLPLLSIHPESYRLITDGPNQRRKYLDWGLFHVEPTFKKVWRDYSRALKQRNFCLRQQQINEASSWHHVLVKEGEELNRLRNAYFREISPIVQAIAPKIGLIDDIVLDFKPGWNQRDSLLELLENELTNGKLPSSTQYGPHRAEMTFSWKDTSFAKSSSRGQQKILAIALKLAQAEHLYKNYNRSSVYLIDELPAELDQARCEKVLSLLSSLRNQILITSIAREPLAKLTTQEMNWFHVERGQVTSML